MSPTIFDQHVVNNAKISNKTHTGDVTDNNGELTLTKINGVSLSSLGTGILRMASGTPSIATAEQFPTLNQSTLGNAATATTATNIAGGSVGSIPYQTGSGATTMLAAGTSGYVLKSNGSAAPSWSALDLSSVVSGTLPVSAGGTGVSTLAAGIVKSNGTSQFQRVDAPTGDIVGTTDIQVLTNKAMGEGTSFLSPIPVEYGGTGVTTLAAGIVKSNGTGQFQRVDAPTGPIVGTTDIQVLTNKTLTSPTINGSTINNSTLSNTNLGVPTSGTLTNCSGLPLTTGVTGTLLVEKGGTGQTSYTVGDILFANTTTSLSKLSSVAAGNVLLSNGINSAPIYGKVYLNQVGSDPSHVTGILPIANGGTGTTTGAIGADLATAIGILGVAKGGTGVDLSTGSGVLYNDSGITQISSAFGEYYVSNPSATSFTGIDFWEKVAGTTLLHDFGTEGMTMPFNNQLRYDGTPTRKFFITTCGSYVGTNGNIIKISIAVNGEHLESSITQVTTTSSSNKIQISSQCIASLSTDDYVEVLVKNVTSTNSVTFETLNLCAHALI